MRKQTKEIATKECELLQDKNPGTALHVEYCTKSKEYVVVETSSGLHLHNDPENTPDYLKRLMKQ